MGAHMGRRAWLASLVIVLASLAWSVRAEAQSPVGTCVQVHLPEGEDEPGFRRLVLSELSRHRTHQAAEQGCLSHLRVEVFFVGDQRYLTARMSGEVPYRVRVEGEGIGPLESALSEALTVVLHNDPVRLRGPQRDAGLVGWLGTMRRRGVTVWGVQLHEMAVYAQGKACFVPAVGLMLAREAGSWQVGLGAGVGADLQGERSTVRLTSLLRVEAQLAYFFSEQASTSFYTMGMAGLLNQRFEGPVDATRRDDQSVAGAALGLRAGVELLRETDTRMHLFVEGVAPLYGSTDEDVGLVEGWTPVVGGGVGVVF